MDSSQLELFTQETPDSKPRMPTSFLAYVKKFEKAVLLLMSFVVIAVIAFSIGVEKGKGMSLPEAREASMDKAFQSATPAAMRSTVLPPVQPQAQIPVPETSGAPIIPEVSATVQTQKKPAQGRFVIQIGSFASKANAQHEINLLKKRGFSPTIITKGRYSILCVGFFASKEAAQSSLSKLQKSYPGCFIRRQ
ncbi:MAG TPA: SPOR domain-containing protein [Candidatus Omnitrophota bacterium]|nr:SPOR domain-containing protein [Candidatus Omnitrophota bacterium]HPT07643.1 SPOR domain-containing protein [Candidatus Omnitrophota bacterium]